jgi:hypothetical protein
MDSDCKLEAQASFSLQKSIIQAAMQLSQSTRVVLERLRCLTPFGPTGGNKWGEPKEEKRGSLDGRLTRGLRFGANQMGQSILCHLGR